MKKRASSIEEGEDNDVVAAWQWWKGLITAYKDGSVICPKSPTRSSIRLSLRRRLVPSTDTLSRNTEVYHLAWNDN